MKKETYRNNKKIVLVVGMGTSPAVLTETVWALAHQTAAVVPDEIVVLVTKIGKQQLQQELLTGKPSVWSQMCEALRAEKINIKDKLIFGETSIRVLPDANGNEIDDLRSGEDNMRAADFMLKQLRQYTESSDTVVLTSIVGGRKTMSALLFSCMSLLGREEDKVYHVLLPREFEGGIKPKMYFPVKGTVYTNTQTGKKYKSEEYTSELFEVPYVRMRGWYQEKYKAFPPSYHTLVERVQSAIPMPTYYPQMKMDAYNGRFFVDGVDAKLSKYEFAVLLLCVQKCDKEDMQRRLMAVRKVSCVGESQCRWLSEYKEDKRRFGIPGVAGYYEDPKCDLSDVTYSLREKLKRVGMPNYENLVPKGSAATTFPVEKIEWENKEKLANICRYFILSN